MLLRIIGNIAATAWFFVIMIWTVLMHIFVNIMILFADILGPIKSGYGTTTVGFAFLFMVGIVYAITGLVPAFRKCYYKFPWLYPTTVILSMQLLILSIAELIISKGYSTMSTPTHVISVIIMIIQVVACRAVMCWYLDRNPMVLRKYS